MAVAIMAMLMMTLEKEDVLLNAIRLAIKKDKRMILRRNGKKVKPAA
jgi:hypothetical protein